MLKSFNFTSILSIKDHIFKKHFMLETMSITKAFGRNLVFEVPLKITLRK